MENKKKKTGETNLFVCLFVWLLLLLLAVAYILVVVLLLLLLLLFSFLKWVLSKRKEFAPHASKFFPF